jgi:hypothetical protein
MYDIASRAFIGFVGVGYSLLLIWLARSVLRDQLSLQLTKSLTCLLVLLNSLHLGVWQLKEEGPTRTNPKSSFSRSRS